MSSTQPITLSGAALDLSGRVAQNTTVVASPAGASETIVASVTVPSGIVITSGVLVVCVFGVTIGTNGVSYRARVRNTNVTGTVVGDTGVVTASAASLYEVTVIGFDTAAVAGTLEKVTLTVASGSASSTVTPLNIFCLAV